MNNLQVIEEREVLGKELNEKLKLGGFRVLKGYDNLYCINCFGDIVAPSYVDKNKKIRKIKLIKPTLTKKGYLRVALNKNGKQKRLYVHRLVAEAFIPKTENKPYINHIDGNKQNNHYSNLEWCTNRENIIHSYRMGLRVGTVHIGEKNNNAKLTNQDVVAIFNSNDEVKKLASKYNVSESCIYKIKQRKLWRHLDSSSIKDNGILPMIEREEAKSA